MFLPNVKYTSNMAAWFCAQFNDVTTPYALNAEGYFVAALLTYDCVSRTV